MDTPQYDDERNEMNTSTAIINKVVKQGYTECFKAEKKGLYAPARDKYYQPHEVNVVNFYRFEGESDPGDNSILYIIETADGLKGTLIDSYGPTADRAVTAFMEQVEGLHKKNT